MKHIGDSLLDAVISALRQDPATVALAMIRTSVTGELLEPIQFPSGRPPLNVTPARSSVRLSESCDHCRRSFPRL